MYSNNLWHECKLCGQKIKDLADIYQKKTKKKYRINYSKIFRDHIILDHKITLEDYFNPTAKCLCGICNKTVPITTTTGGFKDSEYACGRYKGLMEWAEQAKQSRLGTNNPMYGKKAWNTGLDISHPTIAKMAEAQKNKFVPEEVRIKQSNAAKKRTVHGHTGRKHSEESKQKMRDSTLKMIKEGKFKQNKTVPFLAFESIIKSLNIKYEIEKQLHHWSFDFYLVDYNIYIEIDGDYWHSNPKIYTKGPISKTQKINYTRDLSKNKFCKNNDICLIRFWESDILSDKQEIICKLKKLCQ